MRQLIIDTLTIDLDLNKEKIIEIRWSELSDWVIKENKLHENDKPNKLKSEVNLKRSVI